MILLNHGTVKSVVQRGGSVDLHHGQWKMSILVGES